MSPARADQIVVDDQHPLLANQAELADNVRNRPLVVAESVKRRDAAKAAIERTAARCLDRAKRIIAGQQIVAGRRHPVHCRVRTLIERLQGAMSGIFEDLAPNLLSFARHNRVNAGRGLVRAHRGVNTTHDDRDAASTELGGDLIRAVCLRRERSHADQARARQLLVLRLADVLIEDRDLPFRRRQRRERQQTQWLPNAVAIPATAFEVGKTD